MPCAVLDGRRHEARVVLAPQVRPEQLETLVLEEECARPDEGVLRLREARTVQPLVGREPLVVARGDVVVEGARA